MAFSDSTLLNERLTPFLSFDRQQWAELRKSVPLKLTEQDLKPLLGINEDLSLDEVSTIYLPLARLINYYIEENLRRQTVLTRFLGGDKQKNSLYYQHCRQCCGGEKHFRADFAITLIKLATSA